MAAKNACLAETLAQGSHALMKKILKKRRVWAFFHQQYLEEFDIYKKRKAEKQDLVQYLLDVDSIEID